MVSPLNSQGQPGMASGAPGPADRLTSTTTNTGTGQTRTSGRFGQFQTDDMAFLLQAAASDPRSAALILRLAQGQQGRPLGRFAGARDSLYGNAFQAALGLAGTPGFGTLEDMAGDFLNEGVTGNDLLGYAGGLGQQALGVDFTGMETGDMEEILKAGLALQGLNMGGIGQSVRGGQLDDIIWQDIMRSFQNRDDSRNFADLLQNSPYQKAMSVFGR